MFRLSRWAIDAVVTLLALYTLVYVPLGTHTGLQHLRNILSTREAKQAGRGLMEAADKVRKKLLADLTPIDTPGAPVLPELSGHEARQRPQRKPANLAKLSRSEPDAAPPSAVPDAGADASLQ